MRPTDPTTCRDLLAAIWRPVARRRRTDQSGLALLDVLLGMAIFSLIAVIAVQSMGHVRARAYVTRVVSDAMQVALGIEGYMTDAGQLPAALADGPANSDDTQVTTGDLGVNLSTGAAIRSYTVAEDGDNYSVCVDHTDSQAWAFYDSAADGITGSGIGIGTSETCTANLKDGDEDGDDEPTPTPTPTLAACTVGISSHIGFSPDAGATWETSYLIRSYSPEDCDRTALYSAIEGHIRSQHPAANPSGTRPTTVDPANDAGWQGNILGTLIPSEFMAGVQSWLAGAHPDVVVEIHWDDAGSGGSGGSGSGGDGADADDDGFSLAEETAMGSDPNDASSPWAGGRNGDADGDGHSNWVEFEAGGHTAVTDPAVLGTGGGGEGGQTATLIAATVAPNGGGTLITVTGTGMRSLVAGKASFAGMTQSVVINVSDDSTLTFSGPPAGFSTTLGMGDLSFVGVDAAGKLTAPLLITV
ncbi:type II secretion system protein [Nocardioides pinisoli]|uniref:Type II secretion system GspH family protein n=1 Tax=Nocardioides pinisoli TaxID=2950279 RepID=A0ABT1KRH2_9ACTN|nr:type II secretion system protein [Nocardioides pinisoli]MCP3420343.1 type II secretion system GspH family protein [Nocardioides pinisoli]